MNRRSFLVGAGCAAGSLSGCTDLAGRADAEVAERDLPDRPEGLTPESVAAYVADYEEVRAHNSHAADGAAEVTIDATATFDHAAGDDHVATAQHAGTVYHENDEGVRSVGEVYSEPTPYLVSPERTLSMDVDRRTVGDGDRESGDDDDREPAGDESTSPPLGVRLLNVTGEPREVVVTVTRTDPIDDGEDGSADDAEGAAADDDAEAETVAEVDTAVAAESAVVLASIANVRGGYHVIARMEDNGVTGEGRIEVGLPSADRDPNVDVVIDDAGISTWHLPSFDGI
ncbi:hypothetical protein [Halorubrum trueperi]|uniref:Uncharacterized protein n=1 Tax=Halorubrum trueperi TaxID=2004704 RepID=A0ABD5URN4_9EURY